MSELLPRERLNLSTLLDRMAENYRPDFEDGGRSLHLVPAQDMEVEGDRRLLNQALANLLDNALRHTPPGTGVTISGERTKEGVKVTVADDGPGVPVQQRARLFDRFARAEAARSTPGHGLGLAMVRAIALAHGGDARILDDRNGFTVEIRIRG